MVNFPLGLATRRRKHLCWLNTMKIVKLHLNDDYNNINCFFCRRELYGRNRRKRRYVHFPFVVVVVVVVVVMALSFLSRCPNFHTPQKLVFRIPIQFRIGVIYWLFLY